MKTRTEKPKVSIAEIIWYSICLGMALWGLTFIVLGLIGHYAELPTDDNGLLKASNSWKDTFKLTFLQWGLISLGIGVVGALPVLLITSRKVDREYEKAQRRAALRASARKMEQQTEEEEVKALEDQAVKEIAEAEAKGDAQAEAPELEPVVEEKK